MGIDLTVPDITTMHRRSGDKWSAESADVLSATIAEMDFPLAEPVQSVLHDAIRRSDLGYAPAHPRPLFDAFSAFAARRLGWAVDPEQIRLVPDLMTGLVELCRVLAEPGSSIAFASPCYPPIRSDLPDAGFRVQPLPLRPDATFDLEALDDALHAGVRVVLLVNPHNPTGHVPSMTELAAIAELCASYDAWVLSDEIHAPLVLAGSTFTPWLSVSDAARRRGIALTSASKAFNLPALKTALIVTANDEAQDAIRRLPVNLGARVGLLGILASRAAFVDGDPWLDAVLAVLDGNRTRLGDLLAEWLPEVAWRPPAGTYLAWLDCRALDLPEDPTVWFRSRGRVGLSRGAGYGPEGVGFVRLNFATSPEMLTEAIRRMAVSLG